MLNLLNFEKPLWLENLVVAGIDEVGRGCLAGPLVAGIAVWDSRYILEQEELLQKTLQDQQLDPNGNRTFILRKLKKVLDPQSDLYHLIQINDSKKVAEPLREKLAAFINEHAAQTTIIEISNIEIDENGVGEANKKAFQLCAEKIQNLGHILTDHFHMPKWKHTAIDKGDAKSLSIAAASIIAKVYRDNLMKTKFHEMYPQYGFDKNVGYGTAEHIETIRIYGHSDLHRRSFKIGNS